MRAKAVENNSGSDAPEYHDFSTTELHYGSAIPTRHPYSFHTTHRRSSLLRTCIVDVEMFSDFPVNSCGAFGGHSDTMMAES